MNVNRILSFLFLLLLLTSCGSKYKIEGSSSVARLDGKKLYLKIFKNNEWIPIDSAEVIHGMFTMKGPVDSVSMVTLYMDNESIMPIVLEEGSIVVSIENTQISVKGTPLNDAFYSFIDKKHSMEIKIEDLQRKEARMVMDGVNLEDVHEELNKEGEALVKEMNVYVKKFVSDNYENVLGPTVFMMLCSSLPYPIMTPRIEDIMKDAPVSFKNDKMVREFIAKAKENMQLLEERRRMEQNARRMHP
ncbi:DUF4369 domain-containing protein [uncultured Bacteroides sp.]|uniref:DUF4369 domain-containing protein n=1 Tax=uncultured Bacteroides sp. TaxID=162156 RepID=UPI00374A7856